jgi:hypothetical protein
MSLVLLSQKVAAKFQFLFAAVGAAAIPGSATVQSPDGGFAYTTARTAPASVHSYWTPKRMNAARPKAISPPSSATTAPTAAPVPSGKPGAMGGMRPTVPGIGEAPLTAPQPNAAPKPLSSPSKP